MALEILVKTFDRQKDLGELCFRDISEAIACSKLLASDERVPRVLQAKGIKASICTQNSSCLKIAQPSAKWLSFFELSILLRGFSDEGVRIKNEKLLEASC